MSKKFKLGLAIRMRLLDGAMVKNPTANSGDTSDVGSIPGSERFPGEGNDNPLQHSCLEKSTQRNLVGYSPWGCKQSDKT